MVDSSLLMRKLIEPSVEFEQSYISYIQELGNEERYPYPMDLEYTDFAVYVKTLNGYSKGIELPNHLVPNTTYWLIEDNEILACSHLRHTLNDELMHAGGHIGFGVRPSQRGRGVGKHLLSLTIAKAIGKGLSDIHIHCYENNAISSKLISSLGACLDSTVVVNNGSDKVLRYIYSDG